MVSVSTSARSRDVPTSHLGLFSTKNANFSVSSRSREDDRRLGLGHLRLVPKTNFWPNCAGHIKISYRRDDAHRRSLSPSRSFKVTNFDTDRKPVCDFKVNDTKVNHISYVPFSSYRAVFVTLSPLTKRRLSLTHSYSVISLNICSSHILQKN